MAENMHIPAIRFKGFNDEWVEMNLGDICEIGDIDHRMPPSVSDGIPYVMTGGFIGINELDFKKSKLISNEEYEKLSKKIKPEQGDVILARYASVGAVRYVETQLKFLVSYSCAILKLSTSNKGRYVFYYLKSNYSQNQIELEINTGSQRNIGIDSLKKLLIHLPNENEQLRLAKLFQNLDKLISLHQAKVNKLVNLKKAMLEKMFPKNGADVPEIRFKGFVGAWGKKLFGEAFANIPNNTLSRAQLNYDFGLAKNVHYGDVLIKFGELLDTENEEIPFITDDNLARKYNASHLKNGDVIIADAAEDETVGKCTEVINLGNQIIVAGLHTIAIRPLQFFASKYLGYFMNSVAYRNQLLRLMQGTKVLSISKSVIKDTSILYPVESEEQAQIGAYFQNLDKLITLHQSELDKLNNLKKACLEKMFV